MFTLFLGPVISRSAFSSKLGRLLKDELASYQISSETAKDSFEPIVMLALLRSIFKRIKLYKKNKKSVKNFKILMKTHNS